jgi:ubiquinone/menaquinone biosynthesis C-methylase UbiE
MGHKFDVSKRRKLDSEERRRILPPYETLKKVGLQEGDIMADIGCGIGYFTIPASEIVGPKGQIYAMDISPEMLADVDKKVLEEGISNIKTVRTGENDFKVEAESVTYGFICAVLHEVKDAGSFLTETKRMLSEQGRVAIIEWQKAEMKFGPPVDHRLDMRDVEQMLLDHGFRNIRGIDIGEYFYAVLGQK